VLGNDQTRDSHNCGKPCGLPFKSLTTACGWRSGRFASATSVVLVPLHGRGEERELCGFARWRIGQPVGRLCTVCYVLRAQSPANDQGRAEKSCHRHLRGRLDPRVVVGWHTATCVRVAEGKLLTNGLYSLSQTAPGAGTSAGEGSKTLGNAGNGDPATPGGHRSVTYATGTRRRRASSRTGPGRRQAPAEQGLAGGKLLPNRAWQEASSCRTGPGRRQAPAEQGLAGACILSSEQDWTTSTGSRRGDEARQGCALGQVI
jgi:hypothetical protein